MYNLNQVTIAGILARDPQSKNSGAGMVVSLFVAVGRSVKRGERWAEETDYIPAVVFGRSAEACSRYLHKGDGVLVTGRLSGQSYEDGGGVKRWRFQVVADRVQFGDKGGGARAGGGQSRGGSSSFGFDDEIPAAGGGQDSAAQRSTAAAPRVRGARGSWPDDEGQGSTAQSAAPQSAAGGKVEEDDLPF